jgi:uncharacterized membrane protein YuzA (DUF378 family)
MKVLHVISWVLLVIGGLNWGLVGLGMFFGGDWNLVHLILGSVPMLEALVYVLVGIATLWLLFTKRSMWSMHSHSDMPKSM